MKDYNITYLNIFLSIYLRLASFDANAQSQVFFTPSLDCENNIINMIDNANKSIDIAVYAINNQNIVHSLKQAKHRNVKIRILTDRLQASNKYSLVLDLYQSGFDIKVNNKYRIEHNKFAIFDNHSLVTGSFNWTESASQKNSENCLFITEDDTVISKYHYHFEKL